MEEIKMPAKKKKKKFVDMDILANRVTNEIYRVTFSCFPDDFITITNEIESYGEVILKEIEMEE